MVSSLLNGRYELGPLLGSGGMADVHRATDRLLDRQVAVKVLRDVAGDPADRARFTTEARTLANLSHRGLVTVLDAGIDEQHPFLVMELVEGRSLAQALHEGPLGANETAHVGAQLAATLAHTHERGVVHRDIKPGNVLLGAERRVKLADFGIARLIGDTVRHTRTGTAIGTAAYLSPEQVRGEEVGTAVDVHSLGLVLLECLTGERAFPGSPTESALARLQRDPDLPASLDERWRRLLAAMTAADPAARPSAGQVETTLEELRTPSAAPDLGATTAVLTAPVALTSQVPAAAAPPPPGPPSAPAPDEAEPARVRVPGDSFPDRAGAAIAHAPGRLLARWRATPVHHRGVAGAVAAMLLLILVAGLAAGSDSADDPDDPGTERPGQREGKSQRR
ncbi:Serine/threonine-protein kinase PknB [Nocardioides dokdonensis FR1436]|uniref:non-specific serine/threonine protein kinase n=1 Tax=Nocardioides dokdonensis FR1436 TaxID=1300347 RepID=A0A1A9GJL2_9ACTN|nr:serine/threonine-protein kinase [Nocardioides dokdonensis]ANH38458.1 Serine/threonine-protein kinase PknB [Nocardioides dokdonensis FR1436]